MIDIISNIIDLLARYLYPQVCPCCERILYNNEKLWGFCGKCRKKLYLANKGVCMKCGKIIRNDHDEYCDSCKKSKHFFDQGKAVFGYTGNMKNSIYRFKYSNKRVYAKSYTKAAIGLHKEWIIGKGIEAIVPIPMFYKKKRTRGYNQAEVFAALLAKEMNVPMEKKIVRRVKKTTALKQLNEHERVKNLQNAFTLGINDVQFNKILLVDDIYTTGATMDAVASLLKLNGVEEVYCLSIATAIE